MSQLFIASSSEQENGVANSRITRNYLCSDRMPQPSQFLFAAATNQISHLANVFLSIAAVHRYALMVISKFGLTFYTEYNNILNVHATVDVSLFSAFQYHWTCLDSNQNDDEIQKNVQLGIEVQKLTDAFSAAAATVGSKELSDRFRKSSNVTPIQSDLVLCYLKYRGEGYPLVVEFEDWLMSEQIEFATYHLSFKYQSSEESSVLQKSPSSQNMPSLALDHDTLRFEVILQSDILANLLQDLKSLRTDDLYMYVSNSSVAGEAASASSIFFVSKGATGYSKLTYPNSRNFLQKLEVFHNDASESVLNTEPVISSLAYGSFIKVLRAMNISFKCKLMKDLNDVFSVQLLCNNTTAKSYPGTLIAFNFSERFNTSPTSQHLEINLEELFDDKVYRQVQDKDSWNSINRGITDNPKYIQNDSDEAFSYDMLMGRANTNAGSQKEVE